MTWFLAASAFAALLLVCAALPAAAQEKVWRLGILTPGFESSRAPGSLWGTLLPSLAERGFVEGKNLDVVLGAAHGDIGQLPQLARDMQTARVHAVVAVGTLAANAAMVAMPETPIVISFAGDDPIATGHARTLARPGRKVTGIFFRAVETDASATSCSQKLCRTRKPSVSS